MKTAERLSHTDLSISPIFYQHLAVYKYAASFVKDKIVLEFGCGEGYGAKLLSEFAARVVGIDYSKDAINSAKKNYASHNIEFICRKAESTKIDKEKFDVICSFQVIEHIAKPNKFLLEVKRLLKPGGIFLLSTPNKKASLIIHPYHFREYTKEELAALIKNFFADAEIYGLQYSQKAGKFRDMRRKGSQGLLSVDPLKVHMLLPKFFRQKIFDFFSAVLSEKIYSKNTELAEGIGADDYWVSKDEIDRAIDLVAICKG